MGKGVGAVAKGVGAVAGGVAGLGSAVKKGFQAGKATVGGAGDNADPAADNRNILQKVRDTMPGSKATAATGGSTAQTAQDSPAPATGGSTAQTTQPPQSTNNKAPAQNKSTSAFGKLSGAAAGQPTDNAAVSGGTQYAQVKANIDKLDKKGKQRILQLLQKEVGSAPAAPAKTPAADPGAGANAFGQMAGQLSKPGTTKKSPPERTPGASPAAGGTGFGYDGNTGLPFNSQAERDASLAKQKADKAAATTAPPAGVAPAAPAVDTAAPAAAEPAAPAAPKRTGGKVAGQLSQTPSAIRKREATARKGKQKPAAPDQATIDADRERIMGVTSDSVIRIRPMMAEGSDKTAYPNATVIKSKNGRPIGEIYQDEPYGWGCFHYGADNGADSMSSREQALAQLKDMHDEYRQQGMAEGFNLVRKR